MNKAIQKKVEFIRDIILIIGIPTLFGYLYILHQEQLEIKQSTIQLMEQEQERLRQNQIENVTQRYEAIEKFYSEEARILKDTVNFQKEVITEYEKLMNSPRSDSNSVTIPFEVAKAIAIDLEEKDRLEKVVVLYKKVDSLRKINAEGYKEMISILLKQQTFMR